MKRRASVGLALAGGGPLGGIYEVGALIALSDSLAGIDLNDVDVYVGVSSGGFVAAALANGISPTQMYRLFIDDGADASLSPALFLRPALGEFARRGLSLPRLLVGAALARIRKADRRNIMEAIAALSADLSRAIPTGLFDQRALDRFLTRLFSTPGRSNDFRKLDYKLFVIATNLDTGASTTFGGPVLSKPQPRCPGCFHQSTSTVRTTSTERSKRPCTLRWPWMPACACFCASTRWYPSTRVRCKAAAHSTSWLMVDCRWSSRRPFVRSFILGWKSAWTDTGRNIPTPTSFCSNPIARMPTCFSPPFSAMRAARICARPHTARPVKASLRAGRSWSLCSRDTVSA